MGLPIYDNIDRLLKEKHMSRRQLAIKAGIKESTISVAFMKRNTMFHPNNLQKIADALDVTTEELVGMKHDGIDSEGHHIWLGEESSTSNVFEKIIAANKENQDVIYRTVENMEKLTLSAKKQVESFSAFLLQDANNVPPVIDLKAYAYFPNSTK